jgi:hypothetical protein
VRSKYVVSVACIVVVGIAACVDPGPGRTVQAATTSTTVPTCEAGGSAQSTSGPPTADPTTGLQAGSAIDVHVTPPQVALGDTDELDEVVFSGGPAANEQVCAGACAARGCGGYIWTGNITNGCNCYLTAGHKWCWDSSCNPVALAAGGAFCTAATCN